MKERTINMIRILRGFYHDVFKRTIIFFVIGCLILLVFKTIRAEPLAYIVLFMVCFGINFFILFLKRDVKKEFYGND